MQDAETRLALTGQKALVAEVANEHWIAYGCAKASCTAGADVAVTWLNDRARRHVEPPVQEFEAPITAPLMTEGGTTFVMSDYGANRVVPDYNKH